MAVTYGIERSLDGVNFSQIATVDDLFTYVDGTPPLDADTEYFYRVRELGNPNGFYSLIVSGTTLFTGNIDQDAQAWIDRLTNPSVTEVIAISDFFIAEKAAGNFDKWDEFYSFSLGSVNGLIGAKSKTATVFGGVTFSVDGAIFNGVTGYIDTNFVLSTDGINYTLNDCLVAAFIKETDQLQTLFGCQTIGIEATRLRPENIECRVNVNSNVDNLIKQVNGDSLWEVSRGNSIDFNVHENGILLTPLGMQGSVSVPPVSLYVGAYNRPGGDGVGSFADATISTCLIGGGIGFNHAAHHTNIRQYLIALGVSLP